MTQLMQRSGETLDCDPKPPAQRTCILALIPLSPGGPLAGAADTCHGKTERLTTESVTQRLTESTDF